MLISQMIKGCKEKFFINLYIIKYIYIYIYTLEENMILPIATDTIGASLIYSL